MEKDVERKSIDYSRKHELYAWLHDPITMEFISALNEKKVQILESLTEATSMEAVFKLQGEHKTIINIFEEIDEWKADQE